MKARWSNGNDEVLHVCETRFDSWLCRNHFGQRKVLFD